MSISSYGAMFLAALATCMVGSGEAPPCEETRAAECALSTSAVFRPARTGPLRVSENGRFLVRADGTPFFYLGDTASTASRATRITR